MRDYYDETGYREVQAAGFKVFAIQLFNDSHPSNQPVDYFVCRYARPVQDLDRLCCFEFTVNSKAKGVIDISKLAAVQDACKNYEAFSSNNSYGPFGYSRRYVLSKINLAAIGIHLNGFVDKDGKPDLEKIQKLDPIIKWVKTFTAVTTYE